MASVFTKVDVFWKMYEGAGAVISDPKNCIAENHVFKALMEEAKEMITTLLYAIWWKPFCDGNLCSGPKARNIIVVCRVFRFLDI